MPTTTTIKGIAYTIEKLDNGNILVTHPGGQTGPMHGPDTEGVFRFEVHPIQSGSYAYWNGFLPEAEQGRTGPGRDGEKPWWSSHSWKKKGPEKGSGVRGQGSGKKKPPVRDEPEA